MRLPRNWPAHLARLHETGELSAVVLVQIVDTRIVPPTEKDLRQQAARELYERAFPHRLDPWRGQRKCSWTTSGEVKRILFGTPPSLNISWDGHNQHGVGPLPNGPPPERGSAFVAYIWPSAWVMGLPVDMAIETDPLVRHWMEDKSAPAEP